MLPLRVIPVLLLDQGQVVQTTRFAITNRLHADPVYTACTFGEADADEVIALDITRRRTEETRAVFEDCVSRLADAFLVPLTVGGWISSVEDVAVLMRLGADKVAVNTAALDNPGLIHRISSFYGSQVLVVSVDFELTTGRVWADRFRAETEWGYAEWAAHAVSLGAGELLLNTRQSDGSGVGYPLEQYESIARALPVPVVFMGGVGKWEHLVAGARAGASAVAFANQAHYKEQAVRRAKEHMLRAGLAVRPVMKIDGDRGQVKTVTTAGKHPWDIQEVSHG